MRVLFCSTGGAGHLMPMIPLAKAFVRQGHRVAWATAPDALQDLAGMGLEPVSVGPPIADSRKAYRSRWPEAGTLRGEALGEHTFPRLFGAVVAPAMLADLEAVVDRWRPDLVINEAAALAAPLVCARRRVRHVTHAYGLRLPSGHLAAAANELAPWWQAAGLTPAPDGALYEHLYLDIAPRSLQPVMAGDGMPRQPLRPAGRDAGSRLGELPEPLLRALSDGSRPRLYLSFGTVFNRGDALAVAAAALARLDATVVVTLGRGGAIDRLGAMPANVHVAHYVDQRLLLPHCDAVVSHAGAGTMLGAAAHGLPQLLLPQAADQFRNARAVAAAGAGLVVMPDRLTTDSVKSAAGRLLGSSAFAEAAGRLASEIEAMPCPDEVALSLTSG